MKFIGKSTPAYTFPKSPKKGPHAANTASPAVASYNIEDYYRKDKRSIGFVTAKKPELFPSNDNPGVGMYNVAGDVLDKFKDTAGNNGAANGLKKGYDGSAESKETPGPGQYEPKKVMEFKKIAPGIGIKERHNWVLNDSGLGPNYNPNYDQIWAGKKAPMLKKKVDTKRKKWLLYSAMSKLTIDVKKSQKKKEEEKRRVRFSLKEKAKTQMSANKARISVGEMGKTTGTGRRFKKIGRFRTRNNSSSSENDSMRSNNQSKARKKRRRKRITKGVSFGRAPRSLRTVDQDIPGPGAYNLQSDSKLVKSSGEEGENIPKKIPPHKMERNLYFIDKDIPGPGKYDARKPISKGGEAIGFTMGYGPKFDKGSCFPYYDNGVPGPGKYTEDRSKSKVPKISNSPKKSKKDKPKGTFGKEKGGYLRHWLREAKSIPGPKYQIVDPLPDSPMKKGGVTKTKGGYDILLPKEGKKARRMIREKRPDFKKVLPKKRRTWIDRIKSRGKSLPGPGYHYKEFKIEKQGRGVSFSKGRRFKERKSEELSTRDADRSYRYRRSKFKNSTGNSTRAEIERKIKSLFETASKFHEQEGKRKRERSFPIPGNGAGFRGMIWRSSSIDDTEETPGPGSYDIQHTVPQLQNWVKKKIAKKGWKIKPN